MDTNELKKKKVADLRQIAKAMNLENYNKMKKDELVAFIASAGHPQKPEETLEDIVEKGVLPENVSDEINRSEDTDMVEGILELMTDGGYGFMRFHNYQSSELDVYVSPSQIRRFRLKTGDKIAGITRPAKNGEKFRALLYIRKVNGDSPDVARRRPNFDRLTPIYPDE
ncbi:MAG TPA: Rho termination factor N-terminal domain-containing protein, partial [Clostridia bacterium]|nr:Rho termination factor N-terminal domain-containing protein [Clostridia bacterium]